MGNWGDTVFTTMLPPNAWRRSSLPMHVGASSLHPGGVNVLLGDGAVRFASDGIASWPVDPDTGLLPGMSLTPGGWWEGGPPPGIWQALGTRAGGEVVDATTW